MSGTRLTGYTMRYLPHTLYLMALRGRQTIHGRPLLPREDARAMLVRLTGQDFGLDAERWAEWIKHNRKGLYKRAVRITAARSARGARPGGAGG
jgi:hypothetical protein